jgi:hypothetical protein
MKAPKKQIPQNKPKTGRRDPPVEYRFKPGQSGNPGGRPKGTSISAIMSELRDEVDPKEKKNRAEILARAFFKMAEKNPSFANIVLDRTEGTVVQKIAVSELENLADEIAEGRKRAAAKEKRT